MRPGSTVQLVRRSHLHLIVTVVMLAVICGALTLRRRSRPGVTDLTITAGRAGRLLVAGTARDADAVRVGLEGGAADRVNQYALPDAVLPEGETRRADVLHYLELLPGVLVSGENVIVITVSPTSCGGNLTTLNLESAALFFDE